MAITKGKSGNALGLTGGKSRSSSLTRGKPAKASQQIGKESKSLTLKDGDSHAEEGQEIPKWLLKLADGRPELDIDAKKYDKLWEMTQEKMGRKAGSLFTPFLL